MSLGTLLPILVPLVAIQIVLIIIALRDLGRPERRVRGGSKRVWALIIIFGEMLGPLLYLAVGRLEE